jgi:photosystem II stability/assembly factor-like uncharacterized protein
MKTNFPATAACILLVFCLSACSLLAAPTPSASPTLATEPRTQLPPTQTIPPLPTLEATTPAVSTPTETITPTIVAPTEAITPWPTAAVQPPAAASLPLGSPLQLDEIHMVTLTDGWGTSGRLLLKTVDGGRTWREVTPQAGQADMVTGAFLDTQNAWVVFSTANQINTPLTIYHTSNGGLTWTYNQGEPIYPNVTGDATWAVFALLDPQNAWVMVRSVYLGAGTHYNHELFHTTDGGQTWVSMDGEISDDYTGMVFADKEIGIRTLQTLGAYGPGAPNYDVTNDGGVTWQSKELPPPPGTPDLFSQYPYCESYQPVLLSNLSLRMLMGCFDDYNPPQQFTSYLYSSQDGGMTWTTVHLPAKVHAFQDRLFYFDAYHALLMGRDIYKSSDGGQTWTYVQSVTWDAQVSFVDPLHGWATGGAQGDKALVNSVDGGQKWVLIKPVTAK